MAKRDIGYKLLSLMHSFPEFLFRNRLRVLAYHAIPKPAAFEKHLIYLKKKYNVIAIEELEDHLYSNKKLKPYSVLITFDDGDYSNLTAGLPLLKKHKLPAVFFIVTGLINTEMPFWWKLIQEYYNRKKEKPLGRKMINQLKKGSNTERLAFVKNIENDMPGYKQQQMSTAEIAMLPGEQIAVGNHSSTHPMFDQLTDAEFRNEIEQTSGFFKREGLPGFKWLAYPNGNVSEAKEPYLRDAGIKMAFLFDHKINRKNINPLRISRIKAGTDISLAEFKVKISGLHSLLLTEDSTAM